jgi:hypothetical protein
MFYGNDESFRLDRQDSANNHSNEVMMKIVSLAILVSLSSIAGAAYAQESGVTMSTDPAKAADVEQRAQVLQSHQAMEGPRAMPVQHKSAPHHKKVEEGGRPSGMIGPARTT